jgi:hypothetical protein
VAREVNVFGRLASGVDFTAPQPGTRPVGDITYLATVIDLATRDGRRLADRTTHADQPHHRRPHHGERTRSHPP